MIICLIVSQRESESNSHPLYNRKDGSPTVVPVCCILYTSSEIPLNIEATAYRSDFAKTILFEIFFCFSKIPFSISVESPSSHFDSRRSLGGIWAGLFRKQIPAKLLTLQSPGWLLRAMNTDSKVLFHENTEFIVS